MTELKPCPFCGSEDVQLTGTDLTGWYVICWDCGGRGGLAHRQEKAIEKWNDRKGEVDG